MNRFPLQLSAAKEKTLGIWIWLLPVLHIPVSAFQADKPGGMIVAYLDVPSSSAKEVELSLSRTDLISGKDTVALKPIDALLNSKARSGRQFLICEQKIPAGHYESLRFLFNGIITYAQGAKIHPALPEKGVALALDMTVEPGGVTSVFLSWDPAEDRYEALTYLPSLRALPTAPAPAASLAIVSNQGSNYLTCIDRFRQRVVAVIAAGGKPKDMAFAPTRQELYVANSASDDISVVDVHAGRLQKAIILRGGDEPSRLALSSDQRRLYVLNAGSRSVSVIDLTAYQEVARAHLDGAPAALAVDDINSAVYVTSRDSDRLFAIDPSNFSVVTMLRLGAIPDEIAFNSAARKLYVSKGAQRQVGVIDIAKRIQESSIELCAQASGFAFQKASRTLFVSIPDCSLISILKPNENLEMGTMGMPFAPGKLGLDPESKHLIVVFPEVGKVGFYNANSWVGESLLDVGKSPFTVTFAQ